MMDIFLLYLWTRLDAVVNTAVLVSIVAGIGFLVLGLFVVIDDDIQKRTRAAFKFLCWAFVASTLVAALTPSSRSVALIVAGTATYRAITSERGSKIASAFADYIEAQALELLEKGKKK